jgi:predicted flap endonuclease-1-like 5' DNA nuclease
MKVEEVEGIGPSHAAKLNAAGIGSTDELLAAGATPKGRESLAETTGISGRLILEWTNHCDLMRLKGVGSEYSDLLEAAGVDSPAELGHRNVVNLTAAMAKYNDEHQIVRRVPSEKEVEGWVAEAKTLVKIVEH